MRYGRISSQPWILVLLTVTYFVAGKLGLRLAFMHPSATPVWPPTGIALTAMLLVGYHAWPAVFLGAFLVNITTAGSVATSLGIATGNTLEGLLGAWLVDRYANGRAVFGRAPDVFKFVFLAGLLSTMVSATMGVTSLSLGGYADWAKYGPIWLTWWLGDVAGDLIVAPLLILWSAGRTSPLKRRRAVEAALLTLSLILVGGMVFSGPVPFGAGKYPLTFLCIPPLLWAAFRFGQREAATGTAVLSGIAIWATLRGLGPFVAATPNESLLLLQAFMATMAMTAMPIAAVVSERQRVEASLREAEERYRIIAETASDAMITIDEESTILFANRAAERIFGYTKPELLGQPLTMLMPGNLRSIHRASIQRYMDTGKRNIPWEAVELPGLHRSGKEIPLEISFGEFSADGKRRFTGVVRDITERKKMEKALREAETLRAVASLAHAAAHEINNPLTVIKGNLQLIRDRAIDHREWRTIDATLRAVERILQIVACMSQITSLKFADQSPNLPPMLDLRRSSNLGSL